MGKHYSPGPDARFRAWAGNFVTYVNGHSPDLRLKGPILMDLHNSGATRTPDSPAHAAVQAVR